MKAKVHNLNLLGFKCPIPVLKISKKFKEINKGDILVVDTDDPKAEKDISELCRNIKIKVLKTNYLDSKKINFRLEKY